MQSYRSWLEFVWRPARQQVKSKAVVWLASLKGITAVVALIYAVFFLTHEVRDSLGVR